MSLSPDDALDPDGDGYVNVPTAPGRLGEAVPLEPLRSWLLLIQGWRTRRRQELETLDAAALRSSAQDAYTEDVVLAMSMWQSVADRIDEILTAWDDGRVLPAGREKISQLMHARRAAGQGMSLSLTETCRLCDVLVSQLRARLAFDPTTADTIDRVIALRAGLERCRALAPHVPDAGPGVEELARRVERLAQRGAMGGDVTAALPAIEAEAARAERDLIIASARQVQAARDGERRRLSVDAERVRAMNEQAALTARAQTVRPIALRCQELIAGAPRFAVPDPGALGEVPTGDLEAVEAYLERLARVSAALDLVERAYGEPLARFDDVNGLLGAYQVIMVRSGRSGEPEVVAAAAAAREALQRRPCDVGAAESAVQELVRLVRRPGQSVPATVDEGAA